MNKISLIYFATPDISVQSFIEFCNDENFEVKALVTQPPRPSGRGKKLIDSKIKSEAVKRNIPVFEPEKLSKDIEILAKLKELSPDFFVTFAFGQILSNEVLDIPKLHTINLHASMLPKYRGASPIAETLLNGDKKTGITTMITVFELDAGPVCLQREIEIKKDTNYQELSNTISDLSPELLKTTLINLKKGVLTPKEQDNNLATYTKKIEKKDKLIDFNLDADKIHNKVRAYCGSNTAHFVFNNKIIKVLKTSVINSNEHKHSGEILEINKNGVLLSCAENALLLKEVKPEGKSTMNAYDWSLGSKIKVGDIIQCLQEE